MLPAGLTVFRVKRFETVTAEGSPVLHDVPLASQDRLTLEATEVFHVPVATLSFCALIGKNDLFREKSELLVKWTKHPLRTQNKQNTLFVELTCLFIFCLAGF